MYCPFCRASIPSSKGKKPRRKALVIAAVAIGIIAFMAAFAVIPSGSICYAVTSGSSTRPTLTGVKTTDVYDNAFFDFSISRAEGFAFANEDEAKETFGVGASMAKDADRAEDDMDDVLDEIVFDVLAYDPAAGDMLCVAVMTSSIPKSMSDDKVLGAFDDGVASAIERRSVEGFKTEKDEVKIAGKQCPCVRHVGELEGIPACTQTALMKVDGYAAFIMGFSLSESRLAEMFNSIDSSVGLKANSSASGSTDQDSDAGGAFPKYDPGTIDGNTYHNPYFGMTLALPDEFTLLDADTFTDDPSNSLTSEAPSSSLVGGINYELAAVNNSTGEVLVLYTQGRPASYAQTYTADQVAEFSVSHMDKDLYSKGITASGAADAHTEETVCTVAERNYPCLYTATSIQETPASVTQACIGQGNRVMYISYTSPGVGRFEEMLSFITYEQPSGVREKKSAKDADGKAKTKESSKDAKKSKAKGGKPIASGTWGTCSWSIDGDGMLLIGSGEGENILSDSPWAEYKSEITAIRFEDGAKLPESCSSLFQGLGKLRTVDMSACDSSNAVNLCGLFSECAKLESVKAPGLVSSKTSYISSMFFGCSRLKTVDSSDWDTSGVTSLMYVFHGCQKLETVDVSGWDTSIVEDMGGAFEGCSSLDELDVSGWDTSKVTTMDWMFNDCSSLEALDVSEWDTSAVEYMRWTFGDCSSLRKLDVSGWNTGKVTDASGMFSNCSRIAKLGLSKWNVSQLEGATQMFFCCSALKEIDLSGWDTSGLETAEMMFYGCESLDRVKVGKKYDMKSVDMFPEATSQNGKWYCTDDKAWHTVGEIVASRNKKASTYTSDEQAVK